VATFFGISRVVHGKRIQMSLATSDYVEAVAKALDTRADPFLITADPVRAKIEVFSRNTSRHQLSLY